MSTVSAERKSEVGAGAGTGEQLSTGRSRWEKLGPRAASWAILIALIGLWQLVATNDPSTARLTSKPSLVWERFIEIAGNGVLWHNLWPTLEETVGGLAIGMVVGIFGGFLMARSKVIGAILDPYVVGINGLPRVALGPFFVVWFGIGISSKVLLAASIVFVVVLFNVREGTESIDRDLVDALRSMRAGRWHMMRHLIIPSLTPWLYASVKIGIGLALTGAVVGELVGASSGLGWYITNSLNSVDITGAVTALLVMAALAMVMYYLVLFVERRALRWRGTNGER
jgi:NitT/TauT family transport system permease protein